VVAVLRAMAAFLGGGCLEQPALQARRGTTRRNRCLRAAERRRVENLAASVSVAAPSRDVEDRCLGWWGEDALLDASAACRCAEVAAAY